MLDNGERLFEGQVHGPETLLIRGNEIFTSIHGGEVIKITDDHITHVAKFGKPCGKYYTIHTITFHDNGAIVVEIVEFLDCKEIQTILHSHKQYQYRIKIHVYSFLFFYPLISFSI